MMSWLIIFLGLTYAPKDYFRLHLSEQYLTCSQTFSHFFRQVNGLPHRTQVFDGRFSFLIPLGINATIFLERSFLCRIPVGEKSFQVA